MPTIVTVVINNCDNCINSSKKIVDNFKTFRQQISQVVASLLCHTWIKCLRMDHNRVDSLSFFRTASTDFLGLISIRCLLSSDSRMQS